MKIIKTNFEGVFILEPDIYYDSRGFFSEIFNKKNFEKATGLNIDFVQDNLARSGKGVLRGMHFQKGKNAQSKLVTVLKGKVQDVIIDIRPESSTYGKYLSLILSEENRRQLFIPKGFAHGYLSLEDENLFYYKIDNYYNKEAEGGIFYADKDIGINWLMNQDKLVLSEKDRSLPFFKDFENERS